MDAKRKEEVLAKLREIKPGVNYPTYVGITEREADGSKRHIRLVLNSFVVGMYCCIYVDGDVAGQAGHHNTAKFTRSLVKDTKRALERETVELIEIGSIMPVKTI